MDQRFNDQDEWLARVDFCYKRKSEKAHISKEESHSKRKDINVIYTELGHPLEEIAWAEGRLWVFRLLVPSKLVKIVLQAML